MMLPYREYAKAREKGSSHAAPFSAIAAVVLAALLAGPAIAQQTAAACANRAKIGAQLATKFNELPVSIGLSSAGAMVEIFASPRGTFTIVVTSVKGIACMLQSGTDWEIALPPPPEGKL